MSKAEGERMIGAAVLTFLPLMLLATLGGVLSAEFGCGVAGPVLLTSGWLLGRWQGAGRL